jgi:Protein of unknown function (DUF1207)
VRAGCFALLSLGLFPAGLEAQDTTPTGASATSTSRTSVVLFPAGDIFPVYIADPYRPNNVLDQRFYTRTEIPETASPQTALSAGGRFGVLRIEPLSPSGRAWQVSLEAGLDVLFDAQHKLDSIGWDGNYGLSVTTAAGGPLSLRFALLHLSAHLGDEYQDRTGRRRLNYTREELAIGGAWRLGPRSRAYGEFGVAYKMRSDTQAPWRFQGGLEHQGEPRLLRKQFAWYAAADISSLQERDWRLDSAFEGGLVKWTNSRAYRIGVGYHNGRSTLGEFTQASESWVSLFLKIDM